MPPPFDTPELHLHLLNKAHTLLRLPSNEDLPSSVSNWLTRCLWAGATADAFISITRTPDEVSIVTNLSLPDNLKDLGVSAEVPLTSSFGAIKVQGPLAHHLTGILNAMILPLRDAQVPIFAISTADTDYVLVPLSKVSDAKKALVEDGWTIVNLDNELWQGS
ncbi:hypothetical protein FRB97_000992 [Tulasnella sp. 331]|nr:hypothetical protein FRB97_000992 [Tulasnella sp. 331]